MKLLIFSFFYTPDYSAGVFRCKALVDELISRGVEIELITTLPNRFTSFSAEAPEYEELPNLKIHRVKLPPHKGGFADQVLAFKSYYSKAMKLARTTDCDAVYATSSKLFTGFLGARVSKAKKVPLYLDIRDIFVDTLSDVLPAVLSMLMLPGIKVAERYTFSAAQRINLVSPGFEPYFKARFPEQDYRWFTNGIDDVFLSAFGAKAAPGDSGFNGCELNSASAASANGQRPLKICYAGNFGEGQGLHHVVPELARRLGKRIEFTLIGDGGQKAALEKACAGLDNVNIHPPVRRDALVSAYQQSDILFLHLNDFDAFKKVLPSKLFEYGATGKPVWAGVDGYAATFVRNEINNSAVFSPGNVDEAIQRLESLVIGYTDRRGFKQKFARNTITQTMATDVIEFMQERLHEKAGN